MISELLQTPTKSRRENCEYMTLFHTMFWIASIYHDFVFPNFPLLTQSLPPSQHSTSIFSNPVSYLQTRATECTDCWSMIQSVIIIPKIDSGSFSIFKNLAIDCCRKFRTNRIRNHWNFPLIVVLGLTFDSLFEIFTTRRMHFLFEVCPNVSKSPLFYPQSKFSIQHLGQTN